MAERVYDVIIVGAGIAGMTAAIYARRAGKSVLVLESRVHGGQIIQTFDIANWPGEAKISGVDLSNNIYHQMNNIGVETDYLEATGLELSTECWTDERSNNRKYWIVKTEDGDYLAKAVIIAVGSNERKLEVPGEEKYTGRGVSYCATCDGAFYKDKNVAVVGGGNTAFYDALYLADLCKKVYLIHRRNVFRADALLVEKLRARKNVEFVTPFEASRIDGEKKVTDIVVRSSNRLDDGTTIINDPVIREYAVEGVFVAVGRIPATAFLDGVVSLDAAGYVKASEDCHTSAPGIFVAGDCRAKELRQLVTAAGDGAVAATEACRFIG